MGKGRRRRRRRGRREEKSRSVPKKENIQACEKLLGIGHYLKSSGHAVCRVLLRGKQVSARVHQPECSSFRVVLGARGSTLLHLLRRFPSLPHPKQKPETRWGKFGACVNWRHTSTGIYKWRFIMSDETRKRAIGGHYIPLKDFLPK